MKRSTRKVLSILVVILVVIGLVILGYFMTKSSNETCDGSKGNDSCIESEDSIANDLPKTDNSNSVSEISKGSYVDYDVETFAKSSDSKRILFFHATWCPQCRALDESLKEADIPDGVAIFKVDYDKNQDLRKKYGVTIQTTLVRVDNQDNKSELYVAYDSPTYTSLKENLLD